MLRFLRIRHLAVIDAVEVEFGPGFNVLTGETGAGKSILVQAVSLLLGGRASADLVRTGEETATVEAIFEIDDSETIVRREVTAQGRSRAFIDGALTTAAALKDLAGARIELHGQHEHQTLLDAASHLPVLDSFGLHEPLVDATASTYSRWRAASDELTRVRTAVADRTARYDLASFQFGELERAAIQPDEDERLLALRNQLANADRLSRLCSESYSTLYERDDAVLSALGGVWKRIAELAAIEPRFQGYLAARDDIKPQLEDLARFLRQYADGLEASPARLQQVEERLALIERLKRKYGPTLPDVLEKRATLAREIEELDQSDERVAGLERDCAAARGAYVTAARALSAARRKTAVTLARRVEQLLGALAMERTQVEVRFAPDTTDERAWTASGVDAAEIFVSPNVGEEMRPLARVVSGGELSRIMLAIKTLTAQAKRKLSDAAGRPPGGAMPGLIFDEIDAGIGGRVADVVGQKLRALGSAFQVLCITHLPQIAAYGDAHFHITKSVDGRRTRTDVVRLDDAGRVEELSRMLGGANVTPAIRASARELLTMRQVVGAEANAELKGMRTAKGESERAKAKVSGTGQKPPKDLRQRE